MTKEEFSFEDFKNAVEPTYQDFVLQTHEYFLNHNCKCKIDLAKSGYLVSYSFTPEKRVVANFVFRRIGLFIRLYADNLSKYLSFIQELPTGILAAIDKSPVCKRLIDPTKCNQRCGTGYEFHIGDKQYKKCRYNCFLLPVNFENNLFITRFIENEINAREC